MIPKTRTEIWLNAIVEGGSVDLVPATRVELFLDKILNHDSNVPVPRTRIELFLAKIAGADVVLPEPKHREELYLARIAGADIAVPVPKTRIEWYLNEWANGEPVPEYEIVEVTGVSPLTLENAVSHEIVSLVQTGKCTQAATPTPTNPQDIVCNNGKLKMVDDELPAGYKRLAGIKYDASVYYRIPGFHLMGSDTIRISFSVDKACNVFGCYTDTSATDNFSLYASTAANAKYLRHGSGVYKSQFTSSVFGTRFDVVIGPTGSSGMPSGQNDSWSEKTFTSRADLCIGHTSPSGTSSKLDGNIYENVIVDGRLKLIPSERDFDGVIGYYDTFGETFYAPAAGTPESLGYDTSHMTVLSVVGTPEVLTIGTQTATVQNLFGVGNYADTQDIISGLVTRRIGVYVVDGTENWQRGTSFYTGGEILLDALESSHTCLCTHYKGKDTDTLYTGDANECQIGYDIGGTTFWHRIYITANRSTYATAEAFKAYLAAQYAAGTPVIILYPLAEETTEQVAGQPLHTAEGTNTVSWTAEVSGTTKTIEYAQAAAPSGDNLFIPKNSTGLITSDGKTFKVKEE